MVSFLSVVLVVFGVCGPVPVRTYETHYECVEEMVKLHKGGTDAGCHEEE